MHRQPTNVAIVALHSRLEINLTSAFVSKSFSHFINTTHLLSLFNFVFVSSSLRSTA